MNHKKKRKRKNGNGKSGSEGVGNSSQTTRDRVRRVPSDPLVSLSPNCHPIMRSSTSSHRLSYRAKVGTLSGGSECLMLNCELILNLLHALLGEDSYEAESSTVVGQKRPRSGSLTHHAKRINLDIEQSSAFENIPMLHHEFDLQYFKTCPEDSPQIQLISDNDAERDGLVSSEAALIIFLREFCVSPTEPVTLDCSDVLINNRGECGGTVDAKPSRLEEKWEDFRNVFVVPPLYAEGMDTEDGHLFSWIDALTECNLHQSQIDISAYFRMIISPLTSWDNTFQTLPFRVVVDVVLSFRFPAFFQATTSSRKAQDRLKFETARRGLLDLALPPPSLPETTVSSFQGRIDVPFLYALLQPARAISQDAMDNFLQPQALHPILLPFQKRTVMWMLDREGKSFGPSGDIIPKNTDPAVLPVLWQRFTIQEEGEQITWYYHRLSGTLTPEHPGHEDVRGGILAEEPGLGKTVECIALVLLNPGIGRTPSNSWWDSEERRTVREIQVYLVLLINLCYLRQVDNSHRHAKFIVSAMD
jgi:SNF2-related domain